MKSYNTSSLEIYNSLKGEKQVFKPMNPNKIGLYVCGPTVYNYVHLGNCRTFISFDNIVRYFKFLGYDVRYVRNITDAGHLEDDGDEDKISKKAKLENIEPMEIVQKYTLNFHEVLLMFNTLPPSIEPTATGHIVEQIDMIQDILKKEMAYEVNGSVYFDVQKYHSQTGTYGLLSGRNIEELMEASRDLDGGDEKRNPQDFALWKKASDKHIMRWNSPWGKGFPGWHLECSAMGKKYLGNCFDIHGGGMDLKFPHHECEMAQGDVANGVKPANYWVHTNLLTLNGKKMSKSTGNTILPMELFTGENDILEKAFDPQTVRFFMLQAHYRSVLDFSNDVLLAAEKGLQKLRDAQNILSELSSGDGGDDELFKALLMNCFTYMNDDFNTPKTIAVMFDLAKNIQKVKKSELSISLSMLADLKHVFNGFLNEVFALEQKGGNSHQNKMESVLKLLLNIRTNAKKDKNYALSDEIRDELLNLGIILKDGADGTSFTLS